MKISCEVLGAETTGDALRVRFQGKSIGSAEWRPMGAIVVEVPNTDTNQRAFYVGRQVSISVAPR